MSGQAGVHVRHEAGGGALGRVVVVGSLNVDLVTHVARHPRPGETLLGDGLDRVAGGKGANQAVAAATAVAAMAAASTASGAGRVVMAGHVGADEGGSAYRARLSERGIDVAHLATDEALPTGHALVVVSADGENTIVVVPGSNASPAWPETARAVVGGLDGGDVVLLQLEIPLEVVVAVARGAHERGSRVVLNAAPYAELPADVVALADPLVVNEHEGAQLAAAGLAPTSVVTTLGAAGARWDDEERRGPAVPGAEVVDTTGAGDAFCGALAAALAAGLDRSAALDAALAAGADAVRHEGAQFDGAL